MDLQRLRKLPSSFTCEQSPSKRLAKSPRILIQRRRNEQDAWLSGICRQVRARKPESERRGAPPSIWQRMKLQETTDVQRPRNLPSSFTSSAVAKQRPATSFLCEATETANGELPYLAHHTVRNHRRSRAGCRALATEAFCSDHGAACAAICRVVCGCRSLTATHARVMTTLAAWACRINHRGSSHTRCDRHKTARSLRQMACPDSSCWQPLRGDRSTAHHAYRQRFRTSRPRC